MQDRAQPLTTADEELDDLQIMICPTCEDALRRFSTLRYVFQATAQAVRVDGNGVKSECVRITLFFVPLAIEQNVFVPVFEPPI